MTQSLASAREAVRELRQKSSVLFSASGKGIGIPSVQPASDVPQFIHFHGKRRKMSVLICSCRRFVVSCSLLLATGGIMTTAGCNKDSSATNGAMMKDTMKSDGMMKDGMMKDGSSSSDSGMVHQEKM